MTPAPRMAPRAAQILAQALTAWGLVLTWFEPNVGLVLWTLLLVVVFSLPLRTGGSDRDRAIANFGSGLVLWSLIAWGVFGSLLDFALAGGRGLPLSTVQTLLVAATVLYMFAGAFYWVSGRREH